MTATAKQTGIGAAVPRKEDLRLVTGRGNFSDDERIEGMVHAVFVRSQHAHARIRGVYIEKALGVSGVIAVLTGRDILADGLKPLPHKPLSLHPAEPRLANRDGSPVF